jgi:hypothetical protein
LHYINPTAGRPISIKLINEEIEEFCTTRKNWGKHLVLTRRTATDESGGYRE